MIFQYQAMNSRGQKVQNIIDAQSEAKAKLKLKSNGLYVIKIYPQKEEQKLVNESRGITARLRKLYSSFNQRMSAKNVGIFSRQLATLIGAGMPLLNAINDILEQTDDTTFKQIVGDIKDNLESGASFSNCLAKHRYVFSDMYVNMVRVGENLGSLDSVIERLADIEEKRAILKSKINSALSYPVFMIMFSVAIVMFLMIKIIPTLSDMFKEMGQELPLPTKIIMAASGFLSKYFLLLIILILIAALLLNNYIRSPEGKKRFDEFKLKVPYFKKLYNKLIVLHFTQNLGILLSNKVDILRSFEIVKKIVNNVIIEAKIAEAASKVKEGMPVSKALTSAGFLPKMVLGMIAAGEASDNLDSMLVRVGDVYDTEIELSISAMTRMIEPVIIVFMGIIIGMVVISIILPLLEMNTMIE